MKNRSIYSFIAMAFYVVATICFRKGNSSTGVIFLGLGSIYLSLGSIKYREEKNNDIKLVLPDEEYKEQIMKYRQVFLDNKEDCDGSAGLEECNTYEEWIEFDKRLSMKYSENYVPSDVYLAVRKCDNKMVGVIDIRHRLSDFLYKYGGNIGYSVLPQERRKGYAKAMLKLALIKCKELKINKVLITCDKENIASRKTITSNGGKLENEVKDEVNLSKSGIIQRYWIGLE